MTSYIDGKFTILDTLGPTINQAGKTVQCQGLPILMVLIYSSARIEGEAQEGSIWMAESINGMEFKDPINISAVNSVENEISPWFDTKENKLYFHLLGITVLVDRMCITAIISMVFSSPINALEPINSPANDMYYFKHNDDIHGLKSGWWVLQKTQLCSDIYADYPVIEVITEIEEDTTLSKRKLSKYYPLRFTSEMMSLMHLR